MVRAVDLGGVEEGDAELEGLVDGADGLRLIGDGAVSPGHSHGAETDTRDLEIP